ncbi:hypothetical protein PMAYCL1PPCAC_05517, partial [Pristionchus mayeri]
TLRTSARHCVIMQLEMDNRIWTSVDYFPPRMSQQTESSGESSPAKILALVTDTDDSSSLLDGGPTPVPASLTMTSTIFNDDAVSFVPDHLDLAISSIGGAYSDYYDRIREDAEWNELGQIAYVPLYTARISHGSFSSDRLSSSGSVSPALPSPIGDHLKAKRDSASSMQFPIVAGMPQPFPDPAADRSKNGGQQQQMAAKPYGTNMEPKSDYGLGGEYGSSSQDSQVDVFGGSQESLNGNGGGYGASHHHHNSGYGGPEYGRGYGRQSQQHPQQQRANHHGGAGGGRSMAGGRNRHHYGSGSGYGAGGNNGYNEYGSNGGYAYEQSSSYDFWSSEAAFERTNKYGGPISAPQHHHHGNGGGHHGGGGRMTASQMGGAATAAAAAPAGPLPTAFSRANINDEQKNNLMANLARLCNQRSY